jgi:hypothetical protein
MIEIRYIKFETAKLARKQGFNEGTTYCYDPLCLDVNHLYNWWDEKFCSTDERMQRLLFAPTQSELQTWLRENRGLILWIEYTGIVGIKWCYVIYGRLKVYTGNSYEEALEAGLLEALTLIN